MNNISIYGFGVGFTKYLPYPINPELNLTQPNLPIQGYNI